jgi:hypothetical protein
MGIIEASADLTSGVHNHGIRSCGVGIVANRLAGLQILGLAAPPSPTTKWAYWLPKFLTKPIEGTGQIDFRANQ